MDDKDQCSTAYLIHSWDEPGQEPGAAGDQSMTQLDDYENEVTQVVLVVVLAKGK